MPPMTTRSMNILFLTLIGFESLHERSIYTDLLREFTAHGHKVCVISPVEKRTGIRTHMVREENASILRLQIGNTQKTGMIEKGINMVRMEPQFRRAIRQYFADVKFDLVLYSTPPITLVSTVRYVKTRDGAATYLLLKDIFPQNAVDIGILSTSGLKGLIWRHFLRQEKKLYSVSDRIGCMSPANVRYLLAHNPEVPAGTVEVCPNSIEPEDKSVDAATRRQIREKYQIPLDKTVFVYGGNLGKPQDIPFLIRSLRACTDIPEAFFLIVGDGTDYPLLADYVQQERPAHVRLLKSLPRQDYDAMVGACDVGLIFLDYRFTIPNFPSRLLSYMAAKLPVLALTDPNTDIGEVIEEGGFGWRRLSNDEHALADAVRQILSEDLRARQENSWRYLLEHYTSRASYDMIMKQR